MNLDAALTEVIRQWLTSDPVLRDFESRLFAAGYAVVPVEPTEAMYDAGAEARKAIKSGGAIGQTIENMLKYERRFEHAIYKSMIAAAQGEKE